eukprot:CAMPEP_0168751450 /NCGR_PEP_ID=MMETSP0724-20121128/17831_1 /TAXON_ID=265536 /ORGANISM="Amphiprora sp., Strain CCMP467" /LENGTH=313 /DNA_ID=CAMNT_0008799577 /DNA_START=76 /DNA_END=1018 /DNA_ORIENTATION=+
MPETTTHNASLTREAKHALVKAMRSAMQSPRGKVAPNLMNEALRTGLPRNTILNAARVGRERDAMQRQGIQLPPLGITALVTGTATTGVTPSAAMTRAAASPVSGISTPRCIIYKGPRTSNANTASMYKKKQPDYDEECPVCLESGVADGVALKACHHEFCKGCLEETIEAMPLLPNVLGVDDPMPTGFMTTFGLSSANQDCWLEIMYSLQGGKQKEYHPNPDANFSGITRTAYLPNSSEGRAVLSRFEFAFSVGLTFVVGASNEVTWRSISHKTSKNGGGAHGYPDPNYIQNVNEELDAIGVPRTPSMKSLW